MGFPFVHVCDLLEDLLALHQRHRPLSEKEIESRTRGKIQQWFESHRAAIKDADGVALLSALLPELRTDKVYGIQEKRLQGIIALSAGLGANSGRRKDLSRWTEAGYGDLGDCAERVLKAYDADQRGKVTVEEVEQATMIVASGYRFSAPAVRSLRRENSSQGERDKALVSLYQRVESREAKWLTRLILKHYLPVKIPESTTYWSYHPSLPAFLKVQAQFSHAINLLRQFEENGGSDMLQYLRPQTGVKVGRPKFFQARSIHHCMKMGGNRPMIVERKYDGEYVQLHIDMSKPRPQWIQIFSKSGKDSTLDRKKVHETIERCLDLGETTCKISEKCILEGELLVYSDRDERILPFEKIRKHVSRSGSFLGTGQDSQAHSFEHLCIIFFDIMLLDDLPLLNLKNSERRKHLESILQTIPGRAEIIERTVIDFSSPNAAEELRRLFAGSIARKEEGLVVKPDEAYINISGGYGEFKSCCIKMKKDAMGNFGGIGDFAVVGANYKAAEAAQFVNLSPPVKWTEFHLGCLMNKEDVLRFQARPRFTIVQTLSLNRSMMEDFMRHASLGDPVPSDEAQPFEIRTPRGIANGQPPTKTFTKPLVFDVSCFGFEREGNTGFDTVRFPRVTKIHYDRDFLDCLTFTELQALAEESRAIPPDLEDVKQELDWRKKLVEADPKNSRSLVEFVTEYAEMAEMSTQATTQESTQDTATSNSSDRRDESRGSIPAASSRVVTVDPTSPKEENAAPHLGGLRTGSNAVANNQAEVLLSSPEFVIPSAQSHQETRLKVGGRLSRERRRDMKPISPPTLFLEKHELARAAEEVLREAEDQMESLDGTEADSSVIRDLKRTLTRKRRLEKNERSPESLTKRRRPTSPNSARNSAPGHSSSPRKVLSEITNESPPKRRRESSARSRSNTVAKPNPNTPYPTPRDEQREVGSSSNRRDSEGSRSDYAENASPAGFVTPHCLPRASRNHNSSSEMQTPAESPGSSPPSVRLFRDRAIATPPKLFLPAPASLTCLSPSSATRSCQFARYTFFLSPCIANMPYITEDLLPRHSRPFTSSLAQWADRSLFPTHFSADHPVFPRKRILRCVLVESRRIEATGQLILDLKKWVKEHDLKRSHGEREPIVVVDWRILEEVEKMEKNPEGHALMGDKIWQRFSAFGGFI